MFRNARRNAVVDQDSLVTSDGLPWAHQIGQAVVQFKSVRAAMVNTFDSMLELIKGDKIKKDAAENQAVRRLIKEQGGSQGLYRQVSELRDTVADLR